MLVDYYQSDLENQSNDRASFTPDHHSLFYVTSAEGRQSGHAVMNIDHPDGLYIDADL